MSLSSRVRLWTRALFGRGGADRELRREMSFHIEMETERLEAEGVQRDEARRRARVAFGGVDRFAEAVRDERGTRFLQDVALDFRLAARSVKKRPGFAIVVALTLAVGVGATTAVFSWASQLLLRPVEGIRNQDELFIATFNGDPGRQTGISYTNIADLRAGTPSAVSLAAHAPSTVQLGGSDAPPAHVGSDLVSGDFFGTLGVRPAKGRFFAPHELTPPAESRVAVISEQLWRSSFGSDSAVLSRRVMIDGVEFGIIGVAERGFRGFDIRQATDIWIPLPVYPSIRHMPTADLLDRDFRAMRELVGRVRHGSNASMAQTELRRTMAGLVDAYPKINEIYKKYQPTVTASLGMSPMYRVLVAKTLKLLLGIVALVLLVACANVANLLLFRSVRRRGEFAVRRALGASALRLMRQHVVEGLVLSLLGGAAGLAAAFALVKIFAGQSLLGLPPFEGLQLDWRVLAFSLATCVGTGIVFGVIPALVALRQDALANLKEGARTSTGVTTRIRSSLTVLQLAASMALVVGALMLSRTVLNLYAVDIGFDPTNVTSFIVDPERQGYGPEQRHTMRLELLNRIGVQPGITSVSLTTNGPFGGVSMGADVKVEGYEGKDWPVTASSFFVSPAYFETLGIKLVAGRAFRAEEYDTQVTGGVILSQTMARALFGDSDPLGRRILERGYKSNTTFTVIGIASDTRAMSLKGKTPGTYMYVSNPGPIDRAITILVKSPRPRTDVDAMVRGVIKQLNPALPIMRTELMTESIARGIAEERLFARLVGVLAILAAALAAIGLYSVISYSVAERTREIGVRMALGARETKIVGLVVRQAGWLIALGLAGGIAGSMALAKLLESRLFGVTRLDPLHYVVAAGLSVALGLIASATPARAAARVNPVEALRHD